MNNIEFNSTTIENEHNRLGYKLGWRFLMCPEARLYDADVAIVTLNPGGNRRVDTEWSQEKGNAYAIESWGGQVSGNDPLQQQIQRLCGHLGRRLDKTLCATFVPFRSPDWKSLDKSDTAVIFSRKLWLWALSKSPAKLIVCVGKNVTAENLASLLGASRMQPAPSGWGEQTIERYKTKDGRVIIGLPHLGRFKLFGDARRDALFKEAIKGLWE